MKFTKEDFLAAIEPFQKAFAGQLKITDFAYVTKEAKEDVSTVCNFAPVILTEITYDDGETTERSFEVAAYYQYKDSEGIDQYLRTDPVMITSTQIESDRWIADHWGSRFVVFGSMKDLWIGMRLWSNPTRKTIYTATGWNRAGDSYVVSNAIISKSGLQPIDQARLPREIQRATFNRLGTADDIAASLSLTALVPNRADAVWPMLISAYRTAIGPVDYALHLAGRTGTCKSELCSLIQSHWGEQYDARNLPGSWSSTDNAIEALAFVGKNMVFVLDDFVPQGTSYKVKQLHEKADRLFRGQGNQAGRQRLSDTSSIKGTMYPRGMILSTGEDIPEGHSVRGRMIITELEKGDVSLPALSAAQANREKLSAAMAAWICWLANQPKEFKADFAALKASYRDEHLGTGHSRTPSIIGDLLATIEMMTRWLEPHFDGTDVAAFANAATEGCLVSARNMISYIEDQDPVVAFLEAIKTLLGVGRGHLKTKTGGPPKDATKWGWDGQDDEGMTLYKAKGQRLGWISYERGELLLDPAVIPLIQKEAALKTVLSPQTLAKRLKEAGVLTRQDATRERITIRHTLEGAVRNVFAIDLRHFLEDDDSESKDL